MNADKRRFIVPGLCLNQRRTDSLRLPKQETRLRQWRHSERRGLGFGERRAQEVSMGTTAKDAKFAKIGGLILY